MKESKFHKKFDDEYKREIVRLVEELGRSPKQVAEDIGVTPQTVRTWVKSSESPAQMRFRVRASSIPLMRSCDR